MNDCSTLHKRLNLLYLFITLLQTFFIYVRENRVVKAKDKCKRNFFFNKSFYAHIQKKEAFFSEN